MRRFRWLNKQWAWLLGYFWLPCPICGKMFGGHEIGNVFVQLEGRPSTRKAACWRHSDSFASKVAVIDKWPETERERVCRETGEHGV